MKPWLIVWKSLAIPWGQDRVGKQVFIPKPILKGRRRSMSSFPIDEPLFGFHHERSISFAGATD
jgi:hypothetical protein